MSYPESNSLIVVKKGDYHKPCGKYECSPYHSPRHSRKKCYGCGNYHRRKDRYCDKCKSKAYCKHKKLDICDVGQQQNLKCLGKVSQRLGPNDFCVVDKNGDEVEAKVVCEGLIPKKDCRYPRSVIRCLEEQSCGVGKDFHLRDKIFYNVTACVGTNRCFDIALEFFVPKKGDEQLCGMVKFELVVVSLKEKCDKKGYFKQEAVYQCQGSVKSFAKMPKKCEGASKIYRLVWKNVDLSCGGNTLSFRREKLDCEEEFGGRDGLRAPICFTQVCLFQS